MRVGVWRGKVKVGGTDVVQGVCQFFHQVFHQSSIGFQSRSEVGL